MPSPTQVPDAAKRSFFVGAIAVGSIAALGNIGHVFEAARHARQGERMAGVYAVLPDVLLVLCLLKLKYDRRSLWAWAGLVAAIGFIGWAGLVTATGVSPDTAGPVTARAVSIWLLVVAIIAAGLIETKARPTEVAKAEPAKPARASPKPPAASSAPAAAGSPAGPENPPSPGRPLHLAGPADQAADELLPVAVAAAQQLARDERRVNRDNLVAAIRAAGHTCSNQRGSDLLKQIKEGAA